MGWTTVESSVLSGSGATFYVLIDESIDHFVQVIHSISSDLEDAVLRLHVIDEQLAVRCLAQGSLLPDRRHRGQTGSLWSGSQRPSSPSSLYLSRGLTGLPASHHQLLMIVNQEHSEY